MRGKMLGNEAIKIKKKNTSRFFNFNLIIKANNNKNT